MNRYATKLIAGCLGLATLVAAYAVAAQIISPFGRVRGQLTDEDRRMARNSLDRLLAQKEPGKVLTWQNADSGNSESMRLDKVFDEKGYPCRTVTRRIKLRKEADPRQFVITYCNVDGTWKIAK